ncbi:TPA: hypothetical protein ACGGS6_003625 [Vibrio cholerae]|nr:hypothetical protein [Vibrio cholerae]EJL6560418.1 hypothetical protein [Vibrio cholerae]EJL6770349.1 hypothetical protein [Vibrio cholerae]HBC3478463.1 hypothetical protein [Vibrio cholerae]HDY7479719.1 hypothetical protein [Vibrio vulnificus]
MKKNEEKECFIIMPIADADGYPKGHFSHVYQNIIKPSCSLAGYKAVRADEVKQTNLIHLDILRKLIDAPLAICDLSSRNPNVLFELGIRQAFDKPVVLIQEKDTPKIFDIAPLRYLEYSQDMKYHDVLNIQERLKEAIEATAAAENDKTNVNSIVKLLALNSPALIPDLENGGKDSLAIEVMHAELRNMRHMLEASISINPVSAKRGSIFTIEYERISSTLDKILNAKRLPTEERLERWHGLMRDTDELMQVCNTEEEHMHLMRLMRRVHEAEREIIA